MVYDPWTERYANNESRLHSPCRSETKLANLKFNYPLIFKIYLDILYYERIIEESAKERTSRDSISLFCGRKIPSGLQDLYKWEATHLWQIKMPIIRRETSQIYVQILHIIFWNIYNGYSFIVYQFFNVKRKSFGYLIHCKKLLILLLSHM